MDKGGGAWHQKLGSTFLGLWVILNLHMKKRRVGQRMWFFKRILCTLMKSGQGSKKGTFLSTCKWSSLKLKWDISRYRLVTISFIFRSVMVRVKGRLLTETLYQLCLSQISKTYATMSSKSFTFILLLQVAFKQQKNINCLVLVF